ncbi:MAG TPA: hypothetical protein VHO69_06240 [Phototrophicaceae bacterium]|nr:hypothetical protein [Phototrophicaceae bacterium]
MILAGRLAFGFGEDTQVIERATLDMQVLAGEPVAPEALKAALTGALLPEENLLDLYAERLLLHALDTRDAEAVNIIAGLMDNDPRLDEHLSRILNDMLYQQPDTVYAFVRARLADKPEARWLPLLKLAALSSLRIAINDGTTETIMNWLTLVAREPATYDLGDVLHYGILAAQPRAHQDGELGRHLIVLAVKRDPVVLDILLEDRELLAVLPNNFGKVLRDHLGDPLQLLQARGPEMFLVAMARAARACAKWVFSAEVVHQIWEFYINNNQPAVLSPAYRAESIVQEWAKSGVRCLDREALPQLLVLMVRDKRDDLVLQLIHQTDGTKTLLPFLANALESSQRNFNEMLDLISRIIVAGDMTPQQAASMYVTMLNDLDWRKEALPLAQQLARTVQQHSTLMVGSDILWHLATLGAETRDDITTKVAAKRLVSDLEAQEDDNQLVEDLRRLCGLVSWHEPACQALTNWWRGFLRAESLSRLQRLDKTLEGKRGLDDERSILQTLIAVRRVVGPHSLHEFAQQVNAAYSVLEALADAFDSWSKRGVTFDQMLVQAELEARSDDISPQERQILANNLKELAQLIGDMGDNRTKAVLMRRGDDLDRDLMSGDQPPHSAVDAMKWFSGFWAGMQTGKKNGEG